MATGWTGALISPRTLGDITLGSRAGLPQNFQTGVSTIRAPQGPQTTAAAATAGITNTLRDSTLGSRTPEARAQLANRVLPNGIQPVASGTQASGIPAWLQQAIGGLNSFAGFAQPPQQPPVAPAAAPIIIGGGAQPDPANLYRQQLLGRTLNALNWEMNRPTTTQLYGPIGMGAASLAVPVNWNRPNSQNIASLQDQAAMLSGWTPNRQLF